LAGTTLGLARAAADRRGVGGPSAAADGAAGRAGGV